MSVNNLIKPIDPPHKEPDKKPCPTCKGKQILHLDENHTTICHTCCEHDSGWQKLTGQLWGEKEGMELCKRGCGTLRATEYSRKVKEYIEKVLSESDNPRSDKVILQAGFVIVTCRYCSKQTVVGSFKEDHACNRLTCMRNRYQPINEEW